MRVVPDRDVQIVAEFVELVHARRRDDFSRAARASDELCQLGVVVKFRTVRPDRRRASEAPCPAK